VAINVAQCTRRAATKASANLAALPAGAAGPEPPLVAGISRKLLIRQAISEKPELA
jgi:hypothetical protein